MNNNIYVECIINNWRVSQKYVAKPMEIIEISWMIFHFKRISLLVSVNNKESIKKTMNIIYKVKIEIIFNFLWVY